MFEGYTVRSILVCSFAALLTDLTLCVFASKLVMSCISADCGQSLGMEDRRIPDNSVTASGSTTDTYPHYARLNGKRGWCTKDHNSNPYLQIELGTRHRITAVATQGSYYDWVYTDRYEVRYRYGDRYIGYKENRITKVTFT